MDSIIKSIKKAKLDPENMQIAKSYAKSHTRNILLEEQQYTYFDQKNFTRNQSPIDEQMFNKKRVQLRPKLKLQKRSVTYNDLFNPINGLQNPQNLYDQDMFSIEPMDEQEPLAQVYWSQDHTFFQKVEDNAFKLYRQFYKIEEKQQEAYRQFNLFGQESRLKQRDPSQRIACLDFFVGTQDSLFLERMHKIVLQSQMRYQLKYKQIQLQAVAYNQKQNYTQSCQQLKKQILRNQSFNSHLQYMKQNNQLNRFQIAITKLQLTNTLFRYGTTVNTKEIQKAWFLDQVKYQQWKAQKKKSFGIHDLFIFVKIFLYPMITDIFKDFPCQSNLFKYMLGGFQLTQKLKYQNQKVLSQAVKKYLNNKKKYNSLEQYLNQNVEKRCKKIVIMCSQNRFLQIKQMLKKHIQSFFNATIMINKVIFSSQGEKFKDTQFDKEELMIQYLYEKKKISTRFDILHRNPYFLKKVHIEELKHKTGKLQPIFFWLQIPKLVLKQNYPDFNAIHNYLNDTNNFFA